MTVEEYRGLEQDAKAQYIWDSGVFIDTLVQSKVTLKVYYLNNFYVEVTVDCHDVVIADVQPISGEQLDKYLDELIIRF